MSRTRITILTAGLVVQLASTCFGQAQPRDTSIRERVYLLRDSTGAVTTLTSLRVTSDSGSKDLAPRAWLDVGSGWTRFTFRLTEVALIRVVGKFDGRGVPVEVRLLDGTPIVGVACGVWMFEGRGQGGAFVSVLSDNVVEIRSLAPISQCPKCRGTFLPREWRFCPLDGEPLDR